MIETFGKGKQRTERQRPESAESTAEPDTNWEVRVGGFEGHQYLDKGYEYRIAIGTHVVESAAEAEMVTRILAAPAQPDNVRTVVRTILTHDALAGLSDEAKQSIEAVIDLNDSGNPTLKDCCQVIFGHTPEGRGEKSSDAALERAKQALIAPAAEATRRDAKLVTSPLSPALRAYKTILTETFGDDNDIDPGDEEDPTEIVVISHPSEAGAVLGGAHAWQDTTELARGGQETILNTWEIQGVIAQDQNPETSAALMQKMLATLAAKEHPPVDAVFYFCDLADEAMLRACAQAGLKPAQPDDRFTYCVGQDKTKGHWENDVVMYLPGNELRKRFGQNKE
jgi:hypothetical protein